MDNTTMLSGEAMVAHEEAYFFAVLVAIVVATAAYRWKDWLHPGLRVSALFIYPIKGCKGIQVPYVKLDRLGFQHDRRFMVVRKGSDGGVATHQFVSQRDVAKMALISPRLIHGGTAIRISAPNMEDLTIPLPESSDSENAGITVQVWKDVVRTLAIPDGGAASAWFSKFLDREVLLVSCVGTEAHDRPLHAKWFDHKTEHNVAAAFNDGYPVLMLGDASIADLNTRTPEEIPEASFRPNLMVKGSDAWEEDTWRRVIVGHRENAVEFDLCKPCSRCSVPTVNQATGIRRNKYEPTRTLRSFRKYGEDVYVGENAVHLSLGTIAVGDPVSVVCRRTPVSYNGTR
eukprot:m.94505 g.94505  ORF g.94505 m.94505 type:complete len:344 (-) comp16543_c0_seq2:336-1367(-)